MDIRGQPRRRDHGYSVDRGPYLVAFTSEARSRSLSRKRLVVVQGCCHKRAGPYGLTLEGRRDFINRLYPLRARHRAQLLGDRATYRRPVSRARATGSGRATSRDIPQSNQDRRGPDRELYMTCGILRAQPPGARPPARGGVRIRYGEGLLPERSRRGKAEIRADPATSLFLTSPS